MHEDLPLEDLTDLLIFGQRHERLAGFHQNQLVHPATPNAEPVLLLHLFLDEEVSAQKPSLDFTFAYFIGRSKSDRMSERAEVQQAIDDYCSRKHDKTGQPDILRYQIQDDSTTFWTRVLLTPACMCGIFTCYDTYMNTLERKLTED